MLHKVIYVSISLFFFQFATFKTTYHIFFFTLWKEENDYLGESIFGKSTLILKYNVDLMPPLFTTYF